MYNLVVASYKIKEDMLLKQNKIHDYKFISKEEFIKKFDFEYSDLAIYYIMTNYNVSYSLGYLYLNNLKYVDIDNNYSSKKLSFLKEIKINLINNKLIEKDNLFLNNIKSSKITLINTYLTKYESSIIKYDKLEYKYSNKKTNKVYEFNNIFEEVNYMAQNICKLVNSGISINQIKLIRFDSEYNSIIQRVFKYHNLNINFEDKLFSNYKTIQFLNKLKETNNIDLALKYIKNSEVYSDILHICDKYSEIEYSGYVYEAIKNEIKTKNLSKIKYKNSINIINIEDITENDHVFLIGFNDGLYPKIYRDNDYLSDKDKKEINLDTSLELNKLEKSKLKHILNNNNIYLSYKLNGKTEVDKSILVDELNLEIVKDKYNYFNSDTYNKLLLAYKLDDLIKYNVKDEDINKLNNTYDIKYNTYDNKYTKINIKEYYEYLDNNLVLSYSSLDNYYKCSFKYYLSNILRIRKKENDFSATIGTLFHHFLEENDNVDIKYNDYVLSLNLDSREKTLLNNLKDEVISVINSIKDQEKLTKLNSELHEYKHEIDISNKLNVIFKGFIDKVKYNDNSLCLIDYKTGDVKMSNFNVKYGLNMQLPSYLYLIKNDNKFKGYNVLGFYIQQVLNKDILYNDKKDYFDLKKDYLKLKGYTIDNMSLLDDLDITYKSSELISSLKVTKDGNFYNYSKVISKEDMDELVNLVDNKIKEARNNIEEVEFDINPKRMNNDLIGCKYCEFKDICFMKEEDIIDIEGENDVD